LLRRSSESLKKINWKESDSLNSRWHKSKGNYISSVCHSTSCWQSAKESTLLNEDLEICNNQNAEWEVDSDSSVHTSGNSTSRSRIKSKMKSEVH
jgi:NADH:ubiquinone oxidoreductase subunit E